MTHARLLLLGLFVSLWAPSTALAQDRPHRRAEIPGFDFRHDAVWRKQTRQIRAHRAQLLARRQFAALNAPVAGGRRAPLSAGAPSPAAAAVSGVLRVPAILFRYRDTPTSELHATAQYDTVLFAATPPSGRPYTYRSFYEQLSNGLLSIQGTTYGHAVLDSNEVRYTGGTSSQCQAKNPFGVDNCNGVWSPAAIAAMQAGLRLALQRIDSQVDWTQYDSDGDGFVDLVLFLPPTKGGECGPRANPNNHLWAHRHALSPSHVTHSTLPSGGRIVVSDYIVQSGVGGASGCDSTQIMPIGVVAHETGHGFGLPDLYDTGLDTEGIGEWGLMGAGSHTSPLSPSRMEAWSLSELGWVTVVPLPTAATYTFGAAPTSDTAFYVPVLGSDPRGEYFLLENRQAVESDSAMIRDHCQVWYASPNPPASCGGGLLIWHVDSAQIARGRFNNEVNSGSIHGLSLVQADGFRNLEADTSNSCTAAPIGGCSNRGDAGDPYPGTTGATLLSATSVPAALRNSDGLPAGFVVDEIRQIVPRGDLSFRLSFPATLALATADVVAQLLTGTSPLTPQQLADLDQLGNSNGGFDLGDFLAWVQETGAPLAGAPRARVNALTAKGRPR